MTTIIEAPNLNTEIVNTTYNDGIPTFMFSGPVSGVPFTTTEWNSAVDLLVQNVGGFVYVDTNDTYRRIIIAGVDEATATRLFGVMSSMIYNYAASIYVP